MRRCRWGEHATSEANPARRVVVTGSSTGIGRATTRLPASEGFRVFAVVRREEDARNLQDEGHPNLAPLRFDVTDAAATSGSSP